jgi:hypothetical protein
MMLFFDESGDFSLKNEPYASFVGCLICPNSFYKELLAFHKSISCGNELKGSQIESKLRQEICRFVFTNPQLRIGLTLISNEYNSLSSITNFREQQVRTYCKCKEDYIKAGGSNPTAINHYDKIIRIMERTNKFSFPEFLQWNTTFTAVMNSLQYSIAYYMDESFIADFDNYNWHFDRKQPNGLSQYEKYVKENLTTIIHSQSSIDKIERIQIPTTWKNTHPFCNNYCDSDGVNLAKIFDQGLSYVDSSKEPGIQLIDVITNTFFLNYNRRKNIEIEKCCGLLNRSVCGKNGEKLTSIILNTDTTI